MQQLIVDPPYPVEYLSRMVRVHERHWDDDVLRVIPSNLPDRRDRKSPPQGEILDSLRSLAWGPFLHHEPDFLGVKDQRFGTPIAQPLSERHLPAPKGPLIQIIIVDGL